MKYILNEDTPIKRYILTEAAAAPSYPAENIKLETAFGEAFIAAEKFKKAFTDNMWNFSVLNTNPAEQLKIITKCAKANDASTGLPTIEKLWAAYYKWVWNDESSIKKLGQPFSDQLFKLGFTSKTNEFLTFLRTCGTAVTPGAYAAIHNLVAKSTIKKADLVSPTAVTLATNKIILQQTDGNLVMRLVDLGNKLLKDNNVTAIVNTPEDQKKLLVFCFFMHSKVNAFGEGDETPDLSKFATVKDTLKLETARTLRPEDEIKLIYKQLTGNDAEADKEPEKATVNRTNVTALWETIIKKLGDKKQDIVDFLGYICVSRATKMSSYEAALAIIKEKLKATPAPINTANLATYIGLLMELKIEDTNLKTTIETMLSDSLESVWGALKP
jgi:hypothetical protein